MPTTFHAITDGIANTPVYGMEVSQLPKDKLDLIVKRYQTKNGGRAPTDSEVLSAYAQIAH